MHDHAGRIDRVADRERVRERLERLPADLRVVAGDVDQVDGVDVDGLDGAGRESLPEGREVLFGVLRGPPHARALIEDLDRFGTDRLGTLDGAVEASTGRDMGAD